MGEGSVEQPKSLLSGIWAKARKEMILWAICFALVMLYVGTDFVMEYSVDTYGYSTSVNRAVSALRSNGRPFQALAFYAWDSGRFSDRQIYAGLFWIGVVLFATAIDLLRRFFAREFAQKRQRAGEALALLAAFLIVFNPMVIEYFQFIETGVFALGALFSVGAFLALQRYFETKRIHWALFSVLLELLSIMSYQVCAGMFVVLSLIYILKRSSDVKSFLMQNVTVALVYGVPMLLMLLLTRFGLHSERFSDMSLLGKLQAA